MNNFIEVTTATTTTDEDGVVAIRQKKVLLNPRWIYAVEPLDIAKEERHRSLICIGKENAAKVSSYYVVEAYDAVKALLAASSRCAG